MTRGLGRLRAGRGDSGPARHSLDSRIFGAAVRADGAQSARGRRAIRAQGCGLEPPPECGLHPSLGCSRASTARRWPPLMLCEASWAMPRHRLVEFRAQTRRSAQDEFVLFLSRRSAVSAQVARWFDGTRSVCATARAVSRCLVDHAAVSDITGTAVGAHQECSPASSRWPPRPMGVVHLERAMGSRRDARGRWMISLGAIVMRRQSLSAAIPQYHHGGHDRRWSLMRRSRRSSRIQNAFVSRGRLRAAFRVGSGSTDFRSRERTCPMCRRSPFSRSGTAAMVRNSIGSRPRGTQPVNGSPRSWPCATFSILGAPSLRPRLLVLCEFAPDARVRLRPGIENR